MKTTLTLVFVAALATNGIQGSSHFEDGKEYVYDYEGRIATGATEGVKQHYSIFGFISQLRIHTKDGLVNFKFVNTKFGGTRAKIEDLFDPVPLEYGEPQDDKTEGIRDFIEKPFSAVYENGVFKYLLSPNDTYINTRKALVGLFQTNLKSEDGNGMNSYSVYEEGVGGLCKTTYRIGHFPVDGETKSENVLNVTKIRTYDDCKHRPELYFNSAVNGYKCDEVDFEILSSHGRTEYGITSADGKTTVMHVRSIGTISFTPFTSDGQLLTSVANQTLSLVATEESTTFEVTESDLVKVESLSYKFHLDENEDDPGLSKLHYYDRVYHAEMNDDVVGKFVGRMKKLVADYNTVSGKSNTIIYLIYGLYNFDYDDLKNLFDNHINFADDATDEERRARMVLLEILPFVGTNPSFKYLLELIDAGKVDHITASDLTAKAPFYVKLPTTYLIDYFHSVINKETVKNLLNNWETGLLAYGTLLYRGCIDNEFNPHPDNKTTFADATYCKSKVEQLVERYKKATNPREATIYLRALRNTNHPDLFSFFKKIITDKNQPFLVRQLALRSVGPYYDDHSDEISEIASNIYFDYDEDYVLRIYAFDAFLYSSPSNELFGNLLTSLHSEPNQKVSGYVYNYLQTFTNTCDPCSEDLKEFSKHILKYLKAPTGSDTSKTTYVGSFPTFEKKYNYGRSTDYVIIPSEKSLIPRSFYHRHAANIFGYNLDLYEIMLSCDENSDLTILEQLFAPAGLRTPEKTSGDDINEIINKLYLNNFGRNNYSQCDISFRMFNQYTRATTPQKLTFPNSMRYDRQKNLLDSYDVAYVEYELIIPNEMGFATVLMTKIPMTWHLTGNAKLNPRFGPGGYMGIQGGSVDTDLKFGTEITAMSKLFVMTPSYGKYGYQLITKGALHFPIKLKADYDFASNKLAFTYTQPTEPQELFQFSSISYCQYPDKIYYDPIIYDSKWTQGETKLGHNYLGVGMRSNYSYDYEWNDLHKYIKAVSSFVGKNEVYKSYWPVIETAKEDYQLISDYALLNPTGKPFQVRTYLEPSETNPTTEFSGIIKHGQSKSYETEYGWNIFDLSFEVTGKGEVERKWNGQLHSANRYPINDFQKISFFYERSPLPNYDENKFQICYKSNITYENYKHLFTLKPEEVNLKFMGRLSMGEKCEDSSKEVHFKVIGEKSDEQKNVDYSTVDYYQQCERDTENRNEYSPACWKLMLDSGRLDKFTLDIDYHDLTSELLLKFINSPQNYLSRNFWENQETSPTSNEPNHIRIESNVSYHNPVLDVTVLEPQQTTTYDNVYLPFHYRNYEPFTITESFKDRFMRQIFKYTPAVCAISGNHVITLDEVEYELPHPFGSCWHLAFGDCKDKHFFVLFKKADYDSYGKAMKVIFSNDVLVVTPTDDGVYDITLNGEQKSLDGPVTFEFNVTNTNSKVYVSKWNKEIYVESTDYGVELYFDGINSGIYPSDFYKGRQCGYCGNYDGERTTELVGTDGAKWTKVDDNHNFAVVTDSCSLWGA